MIRIGYQFKDLRLLEVALTHRSFGQENNERFEFLGDSMVNFVVAHELFKKFEKAREGKLSRLRASLVRREALAELAVEFELGEVLRLGQGEIKSGGAKRASILADAVEALIAAIYIDSDISTCYELVVSWYKERLEAVSLGDNHKDPKSLLQELLQGKQLPLPEYHLLEVKGEEHDQVFVIECKVALLRSGVQAEGKSRRRAEQQAAEKMLEVLQNVE